MLAFQNSPILRSHGVSPLGCLLAVVFALSVGGNRPAQAALIAMDDFVLGGGTEYPNPGNLGNTSSASATGFTGSWGGAASAFFQTSNTNLSFSGLPTNNGGSLFFGSTSNGNFSREQNHAYTAATGQSTLWFSTLWQPGAVNLAGNPASNPFDVDHETMLGYMSGGLPTITIGTAAGAVWSSANGGTLAGFALGLSNGTSFANSFATTTTLKVRYQSDAAGTGNLITADTGFVLTAGTTYLLLSQLNVNASGTSDTLNVWVLTSLPASEAALGAPTFTTSANILTTSSDLKSLDIWAGETQDTTPSAGITANNNVDRVRLGTTFADVTTTPEPTRFMLLMFGGMALLWRRDRVA